MDSPEPIRNICFVSGTRADWGLLSPLARALAARDDCRVDVIATNMHISERFGMTVNEIVADGFTPVRVPMDATADTTADRIRAMSQCMTGCADALSVINPDMIVILGDRYEMLAVASAATMLRIPIVHIAGGTISEGAIDDAIRHAITKLSALHLTETEDYRRRIIAMGEQPERVVNAGAIGVWNMNHIEPIDRDRLSDDLGFDLSGPYAVATFHPATLDPADPADRCRMMLDALDRHPDLKLIITYPNNDPRSSGIISVLQDYAAGRPGQILLVKSLGIRRYLSAVKEAQFVIGNSSSGIVEVASAGIPAIDIGIRQRGRTAAASVIHCGDSTDEIDSAIIKAMSDEFKAFAASCPNPYFNNDTLSLMTEAIMTADPSELITKTFYDIPADNV